MIFKVNLLGCLRMGSGCQGGATHVIRVVTFSPTHLNHHLQLGREAGVKSAPAVTHLSNRAHVTKPP